MFRQVIFINSSKATFYCKQTEDFTKTLYWSRCTKASYDVTVSVGVLDPTIKIKVILSHFPNHKQEKMSQK